ncbi:MAG: hypothetical protein ABF904_03650 [Ethanoligenens sp.]
MKRPFWKPNDRIVQAPPRPRAVRILTGLFLAVVAASFITAVGVVDYQSRVVGWNQHQQEFGILLTKDDIKITLLGMKGTFALQPVYQSVAYARKYQQGVDTIKPASAWLAQAVGRVAVQAQGWRVRRAVLLLWGHAGDLRPLLEME